MIGRLINVTDQHFFGILRRNVGAILPGLVLTLGIAFSALTIQHNIGMVALSPLVIAMIIGIGIRNTLGRSQITTPGITFVLHRVMRFAIILLGFQITLSQVAAMGIDGFSIIVITLLSTFVFTKIIGRMLGVDRKLSELIAAGTSVCGASAIIACNTVTHSSDEDVAYAIACVTVFGTLAMLAFPLLITPFGLSEHEYGMWVGSTVHEVAQVVAATFAQGEIAGQSGTVAKLSRVILLAPLILTLGALAMRRSQKQSNGKIVVPWFVFGFLIMVVINSIFEIPRDWHAHIATTAAYFLTVALAAMGLETDIHKLRLKGVRPLVLGAIAWVFISTVGLTLVIAIS